MFIRKIFFTVACVTCLQSLKAMWTNPDSFTYAAEYYKAQSQEEEQNPHAIPESDSDSALTDSVISDEEAIMIFDSFN